MQNSQENNCVRVSFLILKRRLWNRCFPVNFEKLLKTSFLQSTCGWLPLTLEKENLPKHSKFSQSSLSKLNLVKITFRLSCTCQTIFLKPIYWWNSVSLSSWSEMCDTEFLIVKITLRNFKDCVIANPLILDLSRIPIWWH